jgi:hypothetical protein
MQFLIYVTPFVYHQYYHDDGGDDGDGGGDTDCDEDDDDGVTYSEQLFLLGYHNSRKLIRLRLSSMSTKQFDFAEVLGCKHVISIGKNI